MRERRLTMDVKEDRWYIVRLRNGDVFVKRQFEHTHNEIMRMYPDYSEIEIRKGWGARLSNGTTHWTEWVFGKTKAEAEQHLRLSQMRLINGGGDDDSKDAPRRWQGKPKKV